MKDSFDEFVAKEHKKRVDHLVRYANADDSHVPNLAAAMEIFGICERDAAPIVEDAIVELAS